MRQTTVLGLLALVLAVASMLLIQAGKSNSVASQPPFVASLGAPKQDASLASRPTAGVRVTIGRRSFQVAGRSAHVSLQSVGASTKAWMRYAHGVSRSTPFGRETIVVTPAKAEQFLTVDEHQGSKTWQWRLNARGLSPRVGADGAVAFVAKHRLSAMYVEPVSILDGAGRNATPEGLRWSLARDRRGWRLELRLDDSRLPTPYVIDPAIVLRGATGSNSAGAAVTSMVFNVPAGVVLNDFMVAQVTVRGGAVNTIAAPACSCWALIRRDDASNLTQALYSHVANGAEPASYTWTLSSGAQRDTGGIIAYTGVDNAAAMDGNSGAVDNTGGSVNVQAPSVTTTFANDMLVGFFGIRSNSTFTAPAGMTKRWDTNGGNSPTSSSADATQAAAGASGAKTGVATTGANWVGQLIALKLDTVVPTNSVSLSSVSPAGSAFKSGTTVFYRGSAAGSFQLTNAVSDTGSGPASSSYPALGGTTTGWTHVNQTITTPAGGPYVSTNSFAWNAGTSSSPTEAVQAADNAGNTATTTLTYTNDSTTPTGSITAPAASANVRGSALTVSSNSADSGSGVASAQFQRSPAGAGVWTTIGTAVGSPYQVSWDTTAVSDGLYDLRVITTDNVGNTFTSATVTNVRVDNTNPTGSVTAPAASTNVRGAALTVSSNSADGGSGVASAQFQRSPAGAGVWTTIGTANSSPWQVSWDTTAVADGLYDLRVITTDNAGNTFTSATVTNVRVDNTNPTGSITAPAASANVRGNAVTVSSNSADGGSGVASAQFQRSPAGAGTWTTISTAVGSPYQVSWDTTAVADGLYDLRVITTDNAGNTFTSALVTNVRVDNTNPTGSITAPAASANVRGNAVTVSSNSADGGSGVASAQFQRSPAGAGTWTTISTAVGSPYQVSWDTTAVADGLYDLRVITTDNVGNTFTSALVTNVRVDNTNPTGSITAPAASANVRGSSVTVSSNSADSGSGVASAQFQRSPAGAGTWTTIGTAVGSPYQVSWDTTAVADGLYDLRVITTDNAGNTFTSALVTNVRVDNTNPTGSITMPAASANVAGTTVTVSSNSADGGSGVASAQFQRSPAGAGTWTTIGTATTGPYAVSWDTTAVGDGLYDLRVITTDNVGNSYTSAVVTNVRVDNTAPTGSITAPAASANVRGNSVTVSSNSADSGSGVASAQFQRSPAGAGTWTTIGTAVGSPYQVSWNTTAVADGLYDLRVVTTDNAGNSFTSALVTNVRVDNTNPTGSITAPAASANVRGSSVTVSSNSADSGSGVASAQFQRSPAGAGTWTTIGTATGPYSVSWDTTAIADGLYDLRVITTDNAGNSFTSALVTNVRVDNTNPTGSITAPAPSANVRGSAVTVSSNSADSGSGVASAQFQRSPAGAGTWTTIGTAVGSPYQATWNTTAVADGLYDLRVITTDNAGNTFTSSLVTNVRVDNTNPTGSITAPAASANVRGTTVTVSSNSADGGSGVASAQFQRSPAGAGTWTTIGTATTGPYSVSWDTTAVGDGLYDLRVITTDNAGNTVTSATVTNIRVDNTNPTGSITAPAASAIVTGSAVTVSSNSADSGSGVASAQFQRSPAGAGTWTTIGTATTGPYSVNWDTTAVGDGLYDLRVITTDNAGNSFTSAVVTNVRVDNTNPTGSITAPAPSANVRGTTVTVSSNSADGGSGVASAQFQRSPAGAGTWTTIGTATTGPYSVSWDTTAVGDGLYDLRVITTDNAGHTFTSATITNVRVDNTNPTGSITAPAASANVRGTTVTVSSNSADGGSGVASAQFQRSPAGAGTWTTIGTATTGPYSVNWDTTAVGDGLYDLRVITTDNAGNSFTSPVVTNIRVDNTNPTGSITAPAASANVTGSAVTVSSNSADSGSGVASAQFQRSPAGAGTWTTIDTATTSPYSVNWDTTAVADGLYDLRVITTDNAGNTFTSATVANVRVDNTNPTGSITAPAANANVTGSAVTVSSNSADSGSGVASAHFQGSPAGAGTWTTIGTATTSPYSVSWDTTAVADGLYDLRVITTDNVGNTFTSAARTVMVDNSPPGPPALSFGSFTNASATGSGVYYRPGVAGGFTVTGTASDPQSGIDHLTFPALGAGWTGGGNATSSPYEGVYTFTAGAADPVGPHDVTATNNVALTSSPTSFTVTPDASAPVTSIACDGSSCAGNWYTSASVAISLSANDGAGSGVQEIRYTTDGSTPSPLNGTVYTVPFSLAATATVRFRAYDAVGNEEAVRSQLVRIDNSPPSAPALTLSETPASPNQHISGTTLFYNPQGGNSGSFTVDATTSDPQSGIDHVSFPALGGMTGGGNVSSSPYQTTYNWNASSTASGSQTVVAYNNAGLSSNSSFTATPDTAPPSGGSVSYPNGYTSGSVTITTSDGTDALSGINAASGVIERDSTNLVAGVCASFPGTWVTVTSPDSTIVSGHCYRYRYRISDNVGNYATYTSTNVVKVATGAPSPPDLTLAETPPSPNQYVYNTTAFYNPNGGNSGTFTVTADVTDSGGSGIDRVSFPSLTGMTGGGDVMTSPYQASYGWSSSSSASGPQTVTVHNNAGLTSTATFTVTRDTAPPTGQSAAITGGYYTSLSVPVTLQDGSDALSGVDHSSGIVQRESGTLSNGNCVAWSGTWSAVTLSGGADTTVLSNRCYHYRYLISDNVGNQSVASSPSVDAKVDATAPVTSDDAPAGWRNSAVTVNLSVNETGSGVASTVYRVDGGAFQSGTSISIPAPADHSNDGVHTIQYRSTDNAGNVEVLRSATVRIDTTLPTTTDDAPTGWRTSDVTVTLTPADALSGIASTQYRVDGGAFQSGTSILIPAPADHSNDGVHAIQYQSTDNAGNVEPLQSATVRIDTTPPIGAITSPADGTHVNGIVPVSAVAGDVPSGVASVEFLVRPNGASSFTTFATDTTAPYDANWDSTGQPEGNAQLKIIVRDNAGLSFTSALRTLVVDNPPTPTLDDPGANLSGVVTLNALSQPDTTQVVFERRPVGGASWTQIATATTVPYSADFDTAAVPDGNYELRVVATDASGFTGASAVRTVRIDNTAPTVSLNDPPSGAVVGGANVHVGALAADLGGSGVASVRFEQRPAGGGAFTTIGTATTAPYEASWDTTGLSGNYELRAVATDAAGNRANSVIVPVTLDQTVPSVTLDDPGALVRDVVNLSASSTSLAVASVAFDRRPAGGGAWTRIALATTRPWGTPFDTKTIADGSYDLRAQALDAGGHVLATHSRDGIRVDNTAPTMQSSTPANGTTVDSATSIVVVASEPIAAVQGVTLDGNAATGSITGSTITFSTNPLGQGDHALNGTLVDAAGNRGSFHVGFTVTVQGHATLVISVKAPIIKAKGTNQAFIIPVTLSVPATVNATLFSPRNKKLRTLKKNLSPGQHSLMLTLPAASLPPGLYTIRVVATAADGTQVAKRVTVRIKKAKGKTKRTHAHRSHKGQRLGTKAVVAPVAPTSPPRGGGTPPAPPKAQVAKHRASRAPRATPLETATSYVQGASSLRSFGLGIVLISLGGAFAFLIKIELGRMLASPRRFA